MATMTAAVATRANPHFHHPLDAHHHVREVVAAVVVVVVAAGVVVPDIDIDLRGVFLPLEDNSESAIAIVDSSMTTTKRSIASEDIIGLLPSGQD